MTLTAALLAIVTRADRKESEHYGQLCICDPTGRIVRALGDPTIPTYMRSSAKPFQAITCIEHSAAARYQWTEEELAVVCASHAAEPVQLQLVQSVLSKAGLTPSALKCGPHLPFSDAARDALIQAGRAPESIHNNCSGKHAGMLACCQANGWPLDSYLDRQHPLQRQNLATFARFAGLDPAAVPTGIDGCGVPTFYSSTQAMATAFARLVQPGDLAAADRTAADAVVQAMSHHPGLIAGTGDFNTQLGEFVGSQVVAKAGAEGVICLGLPQPALGIAIKVGDGNRRAHPAIVCRLLAEYLPALDWPAFLAQVNPPLRNTRREAVGAIQAAF